ncbi:MAG: AraC family transcriptional regulator [Wenzhouxiangella sp.]|nr:MAG: AraC family transcriptional regulator [Wenzhouxiangella sp.]
MCLNRFCPSAKSFAQRKIRALLGQSPRALLIEYRLDRAVALLRETDRMVAAIAEECGFSSASNFCRQLAKRFGQTPGDWKKRNFKEKY